MKKIGLLLLLSLLLVVGCSTNEADLGKQGKVVTVTTSFIEDMVTQLVGDAVEIELIIPAGEDPHLYIAKPGDLEKINRADLLLYRGLHFEGKMEDVLSTKGHAVTEGFPPEHVGTMDDEGEIVIDPHFWFDLDLYQLAMKKAAEHLIQLLPEQEDMIKNNLDDYALELTKLNEEGVKLISQVPEESRYLITPHDAFLYFSRSFSIPVLAPQGVSTDSEVATKDIHETVNFIVEKKVKAIFAESTTDPARMEKLKEACKAKGFDVKVVKGEGQELFSDSLAPKGQYGDTFLDMLRHNITLIVENLK